MTNIIHLLILFYCHMIEGVLKWTVIGKVTDYGQNVTLFCHVPNCCPKDSGWDRWTPVQRTLYIDVKSGRANKKYDGKTFKEGYTLVIQNLTKDDLNVSYSCLYGVTIGEIQFLQKEDVFMYKRLNQLNATSRLAKGEIAGIIVGFLVVVTVIFVLVYLWKHRNNSNGGICATHCVGRKRPCFSKVKSKDKIKFEPHEMSDLKDTIRSGEEIRKYVRIHVIGKDGVGKTSLVRRLLNQNIKGVNSTDGIDINRTCHIKESNGTWRIDKVESERKKIGRRILQAADMKRKGKEVVADQRRQSEDNIFETENSKTQNTSKDQNSDQIAEAMIDKMDDIILYVKKKKDAMTNQGLIECGIWDFAGKKKYYATHQTFLTPDAIYLLVVDIEDDIKPIQCDEKFNFDSSGDYIDFWLDSIHCYCQDSKDFSPKDLRSPVIMVCTGIDKLKIEDKEEKQKKYESTFLNMFGNQEKGSHKRGKIHFISNIKSPKADIKTLKKHISDIAQEMKFFEEKLPPKWIQVENILEILKKLKEERNMSYCIKFGTIEKLAQEISIEKKDLILFLNNQHKIGNIIFFNDTPDYIILDPNWLLDCFRCLMFDDVKKTCTETELYDLQNRGLLSDHLMDKLFSKVPKLMFGQYRTYILAVMEKFDIVIKSNSINSYYMPCMITEVSSLENIKKKFKVANQPCTPWLVLAFKFLPIAYYNHILFMYIREKTVCKEISETGDGRPAIYAGKAVVYLDTTKRSKLVICFSRNSISLQIWNNTDIDGNTYQKIVAQLCKKIEDLETKLGIKLQYKIQSKCSTGDYVNTSGRISHEDLNKLCVGGEYYCEEHECAHNKEDIENIWFRNAVEHNTLIGNSETVDSLDASYIPDREAFSSNLQQKPPRYSQYKSMEKRLQSFESWTSTIKQRPADLARAGFFYSGKGDKVQCFFCAGILSQWKDSDVPIKEHKRLYPACSFISKIDE